MAKPIAVSAGHLPDAKGAYNKTYHLWEHSLCYPIVLSVVHQLKSLDIPVVFIPTGTLTQKIANINKQECLCAVEIHLNSAQYIGRGTECLYYTRSNRGLALAQYLQDALLDNLKLKDRGIKPRKDLAFLKRTMCTSVITESLFLNNDEEVQQFLLNNDGKELIADAHVQALKRYYEEMA